MNDLLSVRVAARHIRFVARRNEAMLGLYPASVLHPLEIARSNREGQFVAGAVGAAIGVISSLFFSIVDAAPPWHLALVLAFIGAAVGVHASGRVGVLTPARLLARFEPSILQGQILMMVDLPPARVLDIEARLFAAHPEARLQDIDVAAAAYRQREAP